MRELLNVQLVASKNTLLSFIHTFFLVSFSIKMVIRLGLELPSLLNMVGTASSVSLTPLISYPTDRAIDGELTNIRSSK